MLCAGHWPQVRGGARLHACSRSLSSFACDTWVTEGAGDRLVRGDALPRPGPHARGRCAPNSDCVWLASAGSRQWQVQDARGHTFYLPKLRGKFEQFSLLSGRASGRQKVRLQGRPGAEAEMQGERRNQALGGRSQADGCPRRLSVTLPGGVGASAGA